MTKYNVLLVEDDPEDVLFVREAFETNEFEGNISAVSNGQELIDKYEGPDNVIPDAVVLDLNMPLVNGFEILRYLKTDRRFSNTPVIVLTASSRAQDEKICYHLGCDYFIRKPFSFDAYQPIIQKIINIINLRA